MLKECEFEKLVLQSIRSKAEDPEIERHLRSCAACKETAKIARFINADLVEESAQHKLPTAGFIWWKSSLQQKQRAAETVVHPTRMAHAAALFIAFFTVLWLVSSGWYQQSFIAPAFDRVLDSLESLAPALVFGILGFACISFIVMLIYRRDLSDE